MCGSNYHREYTKVCSNLQVGTIPHCRFHQGIVAIEGKATLAWDAILRRAFIGRIVYLLNIYMHVAVVLVPKYGHADFFTQRIEARRRTERCQNRVVVPRLSVRWICLGEVIDVAMPGNKVSDLDWQTVDLFAPSRHPHPIR